MSKIIFIFAYLLHHKKHFLKIEKELKNRNIFYGKRSVKSAYWYYFRLKLKYGISIDKDFFGSNLFLRSDLVVANSFATKARYKWRIQHQDTKLIESFEQKDKLYDLFKDHLHRNFYFFVTSNKTEFLNVVKPGFFYFLKEVHGDGGKSVERIFIQNNDEIDKVWQKYNGKTYIIEEQLKQEKEISEFNPFTLNTFRFVTIVDKQGMPHIATSLIRFGLNEKSIVDNYCSGGIVAQIDPESGVIVSKGYTENGKEFIFHPFSHKQIVGCKISNWDDLCSYVIGLAKLYPSMRFVGWDIIRKEDGTPCCVECNASAGGNVIEVMNEKGFLSYFNLLMGEQIK